VGASAIPSLKGKMEHRVRMGGRGGLPREEPRRMERGLRAPIERADGDIGRASESFEGGRIGLQPVAEMGVEGRTGAGPMLIVGRSRIRLVRPVEGGQHPVPVQERDIGIQTGRGVPPEQMVVIDADLALGIVVTDVVEIRLGQWDVDQARDQQADPEEPGTSIFELARSHVSASNVAEGSAHGMILRVSLFDSGFPRSGAPSSRKLQNPE
jgi:hypothetical protein